MQRGDLDHPLLGIRRLLRLQRNDLRHALLGERVCLTDLCHRLGQSRSQLLSLPVGGLDERIGVGQRRFAAGARGLSLPQLPCYAGIRLVRLGASQPLALQIAAQVTLAGLCDPAVAEQGDPAAQRGAFLAAVQGAQFGDRLRRLFAERQHAEAIAMMEFEMPVPFAQLLP